MGTRQYLEQEIEKLRKELSVTIPQEIQEALETGDLRENTEYSSAMTRQHFVNVRLEQLKNRLDAFGKINMSSIPKDAVNIGSVVKLRCLKTNKIQHIKVVVDDVEETDKYDTVTIASPMGQALKNKKVKEEIRFSTPNGVASYRILSIQTLHDLTL
jgi:transcription elongation factor GreA